MRGAPHYHIVLWIKDSPVLGKDSPEKVLSFIQERITCHISDNKTSPDLHASVTKYQMHTCNAYCKRNLKFDKTYVSRCRFDFPRPEREMACVNDVTDSLKSCSKIYYLKVVSSEFYFHKPITVHIELYIFYRFIHFLLYIGQY